MRFDTPLLGLLRGLKSRTRPDRPRSRRLGLEPLEDRRVPASLNLLTGHLQVVEGTTSDLHRVSIRQEAGYLIVEETKFWESYYTGESFVDRDVTSFPVLMVWSITVRTGHGDDSVVLTNLPSWTGVNFDGGSGTDELRVERTAATTWNVTDLDAGTAAGHIRFTSAENLTGLGANGHRFVFANGKDISGRVQGGPGSADVVDYSAWTTPVDFISDRRAPAHFQIAGGVEEVVGGSASDTLYGHGSWHITGQNVGDLGGTVRFSSFENLRGTENGNRFIFSNGARLSGTVEGRRSGVADPNRPNVLDYSASQASIRVDWDANTITGQGRLGRGIDVVIGGPNQDVMTGTGTWRLTGRNAGRYYGIEFSSFENVLGGSRGPSHVIVDEGAGVAGVILGGPGAFDLLDYSGWTTPVTVHLGNALANGIDGGQANFEVVWGGSAGDTLYGNAAANILVGRGGGDELYGGAGRDLLIGGDGRDSLFGGDGEDLLVAGTTSYDGDAYALRSLLAEWVRTDLHYTRRVANVRGGVSTVLGPVRLDATTVQQDAYTDALRGESGRDWFWAVGGTTISSPLSSTPSLPRDDLADWVWVSFDPLQPAAEALN